MSEKKCETCGRRKELVGIAEIAVMADVSPSAVANWRTRFTNFPPPIAELASGPVFEKADISLWLKNKDFKKKGLTWDEMCELEAKYTVTMGNRFG